MSEVRSERVTTISREVFVRRLHTFITQNNVQAFDPIQIAEEKLAARDPHVKINTRTKLTKEILASRLPESLTVRADFVITLDKLTHIFFKDPDLRAIDDPDALALKFAEACFNPEIIRSWEFRVAFGGNTEVSERFPAYFVPLIGVAQRFANSGLPVPKIVIANGVNAAVACNHNFDLDRKKQLHLVRDTNVQMLQAFFNKFAPNVGVEFRDDREWTEEFIKNVDKTVEGISKVTASNDHFQKILGELESAAANHREMDDAHRLNVLRYIAIHPSEELFADVVEDPSSINPDLAVFNIVNQTESKFGLFRKIWRKLNPDKQGPKVCDIQTTISPQQPTYYRQRGIDKPLGQDEDVSAYWKAIEGFFALNRTLSIKNLKEYMRNCFRPTERGGSFTGALPTNLPESIIEQNQQIGALFDHLKIAEAINPLNPLEGLQLYREFINDFERSEAGQKYISETQQFEETEKGKASGGGGKKTISNNKSPTSTSPPSEGGNGGGGGTPQPPTPKVDRPSGGATAVPSVGGGNDSGEQPAKAVGTRRVDGEQGRSVDFTNRITWQDFMRLPRSPHNPSPPWVSGTMDDFIVNIATPEVLGEWFTSLNNPQIPHKNKAMIASFVDQALTLHSRGKLNIPTSLMKAMQNALGNHVAAIRPQNTSSNGVKINNSQHSPESLANFTKQTMDSWVNEMKQFPGQSAIEQIQQTAEYANQMWQSLPPEARAWIEKEGLKTVVWTAAASLVLSPLGALAAGPIMTASTDLIVEAVKKGSEALAHHPDIPRDDIVAALSGAVASVGLIPFLGPFVPLLGAGAGVMTKRAIQHGVPPLVKGAIEYGPHIASSTIKAAAYTVVAGAYMTKAAIQPAAKLLEGHDGTKARIAAHGLPVLAATAVGGPVLGLAALLATGAIEGVIKGTRILGDISARGLDREGQEVIKDSLDSYIATRSSADSSAIQNAAEALSKALGAYSEWVTDDGLTSSAQAEIGNTNQHVSKAQERESREAWASLFGSIANALSGLSKMGSQTETYSNAGIDSGKKLNNGSSTTSQLPSSFIPDPSYTVAPTTEESHLEPRAPHSSNKTTTSFTPAKPQHSQVPDETHDYGEYFQPEQPQPTRTLRQPAITASPTVRTGPQRSSFKELTKSKAPTQPHAKSYSSEFPVTQQSSQPSSSTTPSSPQVHSTPPSRVQSTKDIRDSQDEKPEESIPMTIQQSPATAADNSQVRKLYASLTERMEEASALPGVDFVALAELAEKVDKAAMAGNLNALNELAKVTNQLPRETAPTAPILAKQTSQGLEKVNI